MKNTKKKLISQSKVVKFSFTGSNITKYSGLNAVAKYMNQQNIVQSISSSFHTVWHNATRFGVNQILVAIILSSISGISRICRIAAFSGAGLVKALLKLDKAINLNAISTTLKNLGQIGARKLKMLLLSKNARWLQESGLGSITLDADSPRKISLRLSNAILRGETVKSVYGNQEGAEKGYNTTKKGARSYHPLLIFVSEMKRLYHTWFRTGSAYTFNGIVDFLKEVSTRLPKNIIKVLFRADCGFFAGGLFDLLESFGWDYLVKVKLNNPEELLHSQTWAGVEGNKDVAICEFSYMTKGWSNPRIIKAIRIVKEYVQVSYLRQQQIVPVYQDVC